MQTRKLGTQGLTVSALGLGCMGMAGTAGQTAMYGTVDRGEAIATLHRALELGVNFLDTAEVYGPFRNEELLAEGLRGRRDQAIIATKFGFDIADGKVAGVNSRPENVRAVADASLKRLGTDHIDLFYQHRVDPAVPIEDTVGAMADLVHAGKVRFLGLSEAGPATLARAHKVHPISALQSEWSLWERGVEADIVPLCAELGIGFVPYSPLGRGFLTGQQPRAEDLPDSDYRSKDPRYQGANYDANMAAVAIVKGIAAAHGATAAQVALAWLLHKGPGVVPIPGSKRRVTLEDNAGAAALALTAADMAALDAALPPGTTAGDRYGSKFMMSMVRL
ncbi:aldo/keto reductase [Polymorphobacter fuscus]|uniref:Aldo/keto reductase n=1 Tax=Sandarakinorhabdus fusca TaxID=1439888 RepID=A0A7C9GQI2_9SPHN|nr:aldo/keto reductase [Polymorphobacter fuscus]KAB7648884.1 aldo/keto reductase [Polymorphobacter fuscus]MQT16471.1 aldo/keto reductase [Polymorphobacter fuscus]NJC07239.1 aryl-alcohol dehydrogenase-like predicted oxidoreductase [Polymorphobacter fuscus]